MYLNSFLPQRKKKEGTKDTKLDVDDALLCVLGALFFSFTLKITCRNHRGDGGVRHRLHSSSQACR